MTDHDKSLDADLDLDAADTDGVTGGNVAIPSIGAGSWGKPTPLLKDPATGADLHPGAPALKTGGVTAAHGHSQMVSAGGIAPEVKGPPTPAWANAGATATGNDTCGGWPESYRGPIPNVCDENGGGERSMTYDEYLKSGGTPVV